jgi:hypothetical protein
MQSGALLQFRTLSASAVGADGVKGSAIIIHLKPQSATIGPRSSVHISLEFTPFGTETRELQEHDYFINEEPIPLTEKAYALSMFSRTLEPLLPERDIRKNEFTTEEAVILRELQAFLKSQPKEIELDLKQEINIIDDLITHHCVDQNRLA